ncbi:Protocadherin Fat 2 FAT tumor suppressor-like protein 2 Precursor [Larimichthys crocea]|uniref:Protocadherin Fat 2 FAT tumor suppressor-like protein 2 n=1 Tax=Larimichthys crocea TaxID=215358 RepID=A0A6G0I558_LARCR|nr:Protocadherin Fat 2 FAT tumor suppressor-like protein 2 Precursor [Larimichthys crocea]
MEALKMAAIRTTLLALAAVLLHVSRCQKGMGKEKDSLPLRFTHHLYNATINENSAPRTYIETSVKMGIEVTELYWEIKYNVVSGDDDGLFQAEAVKVGDFCFLRIKTRTSNSALLNREVRDTYMLTVEATESTFDFQAKTKVFVQVLDTNDLKPLFYPASYNVAIREDTQLKSSVVRVSATDADIGSNAEFYYSFTSRAHPFVVDPFTGTVSLVKKLNHTRAERYDLTVLAEDRTKKISGVQKFGNVARVTVNVQKMSIGSPVITPPPKPTVSTDGKVTINVHVEAGLKPVESLNIVRGDPHKCFEIIPLGAQGSDFQVISTKRIIWSQSPFGLNLSLQAKDRSFPSLLSPVTQIHVPAYHYNPLTFSEDTYIVTLSEFSPPKTHVVKVSVNSVPHNVTFSIKNNPDSTKFKINPKTGIIITTEKFDYEIKNRYEFDVVANHGEAETHIVVEIMDENDNSPQFSQTSYQATLDENSPVGSSVLKVAATDEDKGKNGFVTYAIANSGPLPFTIDPFTGVISTSEHLDYELMKRRYHLRVWASDSGSPFSQVSECPVTITLNNINDNIPLFERVGCNTTVPLDFPVGHMIAELSAIDLDELQQLKYVIESGNELQVFAIDSVSGAITLKQPIPLRANSFTLRVVATDGRHHSEASVVRITVTNRGDDATVHCQETGIFKQLTDKLIESIKPILTNQEEDTFSDIHITNRHSPKFDLSIPSSIDLIEDHPLNSTIVQFKAKDADTGFNSKLVYAISSGNEDGCFSIDTFSGDLQLVCPLDRERKEFYILNITVYDLGTPQISAWKFVAVNVMDVNDNPPVFDQPRYVIRVPENTEMDSIIFTARAIDLDLDTSGNVKYSLLSSTDMFSIDEMTGEVTVTGRLDRETSPRHDLWIEARDQAKLGPQLFSTIDLVVVLQDINDNPPKFVPKVYRIKVPEDVPVGTLLVWLESVDLDLGSGGLVTYNLKNTEGGIFHLDPSTGALTLERELDFERRPIYNLTVRAVDHGLPRSLSSSCFVEIQVLDVNENLHRPVFSEFVYEAGVVEDAAVGTSVVTLTAADKDKGRDGVVRYHIHEGSGLGVFTIDEESGVIRTTETLDREMKPQYWLSVYVTDLGTEPLISWTHVFLEVLDINDNAPELSQPVYFASVQENVDKVKSVVQVSATDADTSSEGMLSFQMLESHRTYFDVDPKTGVISTLSALDREDKPEHSVEVIVSDNGSPSLRSTATVVIRVLDANDNRPKFTDKLFHVKLPEQRRKAGKREVCRMVARDDDEGSNAVVTYKLQDNNDERFEIDPVTGVVMSHGDFWQGNYSILTIKATDQGSPSRSSTARLDIEWIARPPSSGEPITFDEPHFTFAVMETEPVTHMVGIIMTETHQQRWFDITGGDEEKDFDIQKNTGTILIARRLDAARRSNYNMTVRVTDGHHNATTQAYIRVLDMNEHRPVFLKPLYEVRVPEDTSPWKDILQISAQDADTNSKLVYSIHSSLHPDSTKFFHLDPKSGVLVMTEQLDYEMISVHTLIVMVRDQEIPVKRNFVKVVIHVEDCNDHSPSFLSPRYEASISNQAPTGTEVIRVKALDKDMGSNADISYSLHSGNIDNIFSIDLELGSISVSKPLDLQPQDQFHLTVKATDQGFPQRSDLCSVHVHIRISDQTPPVFPSDEYLTEISELSILGTPVVTISASSPAAVHYGIESGNPNGTFHINPYTGLISVQRHLDFENCSSYKLKVTASTTAGASSKTLVYIYVIDENDNAPVFQQKEYLGQISESAHINSMVMGERNTPLVVQASDADRDSNSLLVYQILEPEALNIFKIDSSMGTISLISPVDFETKPEYQFTVQVKDSGEPSLYATEPAKVTVRVLDLNDCPPQFSSPVYEPSIIFPAVRDTEVVRVMAHDADSAVSYSITEGNLHNVFSINPDTGVITVNDVTEISPFYQLVVKASDGLYKDAATVKVNVTNLTASDLGFEQIVYSASVTENLKTVKTLAALKATGCYLNEPLIYSVINPMGKFTISQTSGILETMGIPFDREEQDIYDVVVQVQDMRTPPRTATSQVKVFVDDVNDNAPQFLNLPFSMMISEASEPGDVLYQATAIDRDLGENGSIMYSLEEDYNLFRIDPDVGDVSLQRPLDFEALNKYVLTVLAIDEGEPSHSTVAQLSIQVRNQTNPVFQTLLYPLKVPENVPPFTTILHVQARNPEGYRLIYNLEEENASKHFHIDFKTGVLTVTNPLDYESQTMHVLTVRATDSVTGTFSEASIEIEVEDVNDNAPVFSKLSYSVIIDEGLPIGTSVIQLSASDKDSGRNKDLTFQMVKTEKNETAFFEIDPHSGLIVTKQVLDYENTKHFNFKVKAIDNGAVPLSSEAYVFINITDVNDNPPDFVNSQFEASLDEMAKCGHIVIKIQASDPDTGDLNNLKYKILSGNEGRYFNINESSGIISFSNVCKRNLDPYYNLTVAVSDGVFQKTAPVNIDMMNTNRHSPYFKQNIYEAELAENAEAGTRVIRLAAIDPDDGPYGSVDYTIINKLADEKFAIDNDGQIVTKQPLDRENPAQRVIAIKVMAKDGGGKVAFCTVKIILTDENDNVPQFKASEYQVSIQSTVNKGAPVIQIMAYDADDGKNADVTYTVDEAAEVTEDIIEINPFSGVVSVKESLVGMENKIFNFKVKARDGNLPFYNSTVPVQVKVVPPEVPLPKFSEPLYTFSAAEDVPIGTEIGSVRADSDMPLIYSLVDGNTVESNKDKVFTLDKESGTLLLQKTIDHEKTKWYQIDVIAQGNHNGTDVASLVSISIQVQDVNDNQPVFDASPYKAFLAENMPAGTTVIQVTANDPDTDTNGLVTYILEPVPHDPTVDITEVFSIDGESGWITTIRETDCEASRIYRFNVVAMDHGGDVKLSSSVLVEVTVTDENDNPPKFSDDIYRGSVVENSSPGEVIISMTTTDADVSLENRLVTCYITDGDPLGQFAIIQEDEGEWGLIVKEPLDRETKDRYTLKVLASDGKFEAPVVVDVHVLDINDNSPLCEQLVYTEAVMENSPSSIFVLKVSASDPDVGANGQISYTLHGPDSDKFHLDHRTGELFTLAVLDRERVVEYNMVAKATDGGGRSCQADILLMVQDMNDNAPRFSSSHYEVTVFDNCINSEVKYSLLAGDIGYFSLDEFSGILRLERPLTPDTPPTFELKVKATDRGLPRHLYSVATVTVDVVALDDYQPVFLSSEYTAQLPESMAVGSEVLSVSALTRDGGGPDPIGYRIVSGNEDGRFLLDSQTGLMTLVAPLDFEVSREYYLSVEGSRGKSSLSDITTVIINVTDVNDNAPAFERGDYSTEISEDLTPGGLIMKVTATDQDGPINNLLRYSIVSGDPLQQFSIHSRSGEITVRTALDREETPHYSLTVQAADEGDPPLSSAVLITITVRDVNDNPPVFSQVNHSLLLQEGESVGSGVLQLVVTDKDTPKNGPPFSFHIVSGNEDRRFHVDQGGLLSLSAPLRKRVKPHHQLKIQVTDSGHPPLSSICVVNINVTEQSKYPPSVVPLEVFITTSGGLFANRVIGRLHASDQDLQDVLTYKLVSENPNRGRFSVDLTDGKIWADENLEEGSYSLNVSVTDGKFSVWAGVRVHVWSANQRALDSGLTLQLAGLSPEEFLGDHWRGLQRSLGQALNLPKQELHLVSLQQLPDTQVLEALLIWRPQSGLVQSLPTNRLPGIIADIEDTLSLSILRVSHNGCLGTGCPPRGCRNAVRLTGERLSHFTTARAGYITPQHTWESVCPCNESAVRFDGKSYLKYLHRMDEDSQSFKLSLRFKTFQEQGLIVSTNSTKDWGTLQLTDGQLRFRYSCGNASPGSLLIRSDPVSDGQWHSVLLEVNSTTMRLTLDQHHPAFTSLSEPCRLMRSHGALLFASSSPQVHQRPHNFIGCLEALELNGEQIRVGDTSEWAGPGSRRVFGVYQCCGKAGACENNPCQNGGVCEEETSGELRCRCAGLFHGARCELADNPCASQPCAHGRVCVPKAQGYMCNCSLDNAEARCHNLIELCSPNPCPGGFDCKVTDGSIHCDPLPQVSPMIGYVEIMEIGASVLGLLFLVGIFVCVRKRYVQQKKKKPVCVQDSNGYFQHSLAKSLKANNQEGNPIEMNSLVGPINDLDHSPFRSLRPKSQISSSGGGVSSPKTQGPVVCSVAPNLPARPPSSSDTDSIRKNHWDMDYEVYPADPDYYGRPAVQEFPQFDIVEDAYSTSTMDSRRNSRFGGFPFPLDRCDRRAPLPPCYSNQNLDDFLGPDGLPLPSSQCPNEYTAISYYPTQHTRSLDNVSGGYKRLSMRLSVAMPSYAEQASPPPAPNPAQPQTRPAGQNPRSFDGSSMVESDYGSCEEVMF